MKVFISYASDVRERAEKLAAQLGGRQHDVFFDRDSLRVGKEYHACIKSEAEACDLFVFLISAASVTPGHYSLTELGYIEKRWPNPSGRVLPVLADDTELAGIPPYLGESLNVLRTRGAFAVEVCNAVEALAAELAASRDERGTSELTANGPQSGLALLVDTLTKKLSERRKLGSGDRGSTLTLQIDTLVTDIKALFAPNQGSVIAGAKLIKVVGVGNFGTVWEAERMDTGKRVAVKVFRLERLAEGQMLARFRRSIRAMRLLSERKRLLAKKDTRARVVGFVSEDSSSLAFSMELLTGGNVEDVGRLGWTLERKLQVALDVCAAVAYSHDNGVIHRDIKPANIVLNEHRQPVLTDFDIADVRWATSLSTTVEGGLGTPVFAAPEQLEDADTATERADVYSLGRFLQYLLLERSPGYQIERDPSLSNLSAFPPAMVEIIRRATQYAAARRFSSVADMMVQLEGCRSGAAAFRARLARGWRWSRKNWPAFAIVTCLVLGSVGLAAYQGEIAAEQKRLRLEAEKHRLLAEERNRQLEEAQAKLSALSEELEQIRTKEKNFTKRRAHLQQTLDALQDEARLTKSNETRRQLDVKRAATRGELAEVDQILGELGREQAELGKQLTLARERARVLPSTSSEHDPALVSAPGTLAATGTQGIASSKPDHCRESSQCSWSGQCTLRDGECVVTSEADCRSSDLCSDYGRCAFRGGECVSASKSECRKSAFCSNYGRCSLVGGECVAASKSDCLDSSSCREHGKCELSEGECVEGMNCRALPACRVAGECTQRGDECVAASEVDCKKSVHCRSFGACRLENGACVAK